MAQLRGIEAGVAQGRIGYRVFESFSNLGELVVEAFFRRAASAVSVGVPERGFFPRLHSSDFRCAASPCFNVRQAVFGAGETQTVARGDLNRVGATRWSKCSAHRGRSLGRD